MPAKLAALQAIILCGPGSSFPTFTANPDEHPKALLSIANRPMIWYSLQYCYRMGVRNITLICPPSAEKAITLAMSLNPHLTSLPSPPKPSILAPQGLDYNTSTAAILRCPEVRAIIKTDFLVLPCDIVCEVPGDKLWDAWVNLGISLPTQLIDGSKPHASAGLSVWYDTKGVEPMVKGEETDFAALAPLPKPARQPQAGSLQPHVSKLVYAMPKVMLSDLTEEQGGLPLRYSLMRAHPHLNMKSTLRDAHIYLFPHWIMDFIAKNERLDTIGEDVVGWWAKAGWMPGLDEKLHLPEILNEVAKKWTDDDEYSDGLDIVADSPEKPDSASSQEKPPCPPILAYIHPKTSSDGMAPIIRRVDTASLLLNVSLQLAKLPSIEEAGVKEASPYAHPKKIAYPEGVKQRTTITQADSLVAEQVIVEEKVAIKESVVGANCTIREGAKLTRCVLMDGVEVGKFARLTGCILGRRCRIGEKSNLTDCEVQENLIIEEGTEEKGEALRSAQDLEPTEEEIDAVSGEAETPF